ncbi:adhesive plaque matrix protein-like isoform X2 [Anopheles stephensi]|uniref:adhesive plaque matrix protein-like isoform X2 n=1 Tax=Anopheles stephensi TaxID=30069 RepID=UPI001658914A|nr:adhesive plaque matrix protein-like isoform X2 [Anopheles stephensi]
MANFRTKTLGIKARSADLLDITHRAFLSKVHPLSTMASKFVLIVASLACVSAGYIPNDHLSYAPAVSYSNVIKHQAPVLSKTILQEPQLYHGYAQAAPSIVVSKPLALTNPLPTLSYAAPHSLYQAPALVKNIEYSKPLSYGPIAKTIIAEPTYGKTIIAEPTYGKTIIAEPTYAKTIVSEPIYTKNVYAEPIYPAKPLIAEPVYGKSIIAEPAPIYGGKVLSYAPNLAYGGISAHDW